MTIAYLAGMIDGDGGFEVFTSGSRNAPTVGLTIGNNCKQLIGWLASNWNGRVGKGNTVWHTFSFSRDAMREVLPEAAPYMIVKRRQAELALEMLSLTYSDRKGAIRKTECAIEILEERQKLTSRDKKTKTYYELLERMRWLNQGQ